jgi:hypothetical protein
MLAAIECRTRPGGLVKPLPLTIEAGFVGSAHGVATIPSGGLPKMHSRPPGARA